MAVTPGASVGIERSQPSPILLDTEGAPNQTIELNVLGGSGNETGRILAPLGGTIYRVDAAGNAIAGCYLDQCGRSSSTVHDFLGAEGIPTGGSGSGATLSAWRQYLAATVVHPGQVLIPWIMITNLEPGDQAGGVVTQQWIDAQEAAMDRVANAFTAEFPGGTVHPVLCMGWKHNGSVWNNETLCLSAERALMEVARRRGWGMFSFFSALDGKQPWLHYDIHAASNADSETLARVMLQVLMAPSWEAPELPGLSPSARTGAAMVYDGLRGKTVLFGGSTASGLSAETWEYDGDSWAQIVTTPITPTARTGHAMVYDPARGRVVMFGGVTGTGLSNQTWEYDGQWHHVSTAASPAARSGHAMAFDSARARVVLFGGSTAGGIAADTHEFDGVNWVQRFAAGPSGRAGHAMAFDSDRNRTVLFGGQQATGLSQETWEWDGAAWQGVQTFTTPRGRSAHSLVYDPVRKHTVMFGGDDGLEYLHSTWEYNGVEWLHRTLSGFAPGRAGQGMAFDQARARTIVFGGAAGPLEAPQTWEFAGPTSASTVTSQPASLVLIQGQHAVFTASTTNDAGLYWQWRKNGVPLIGDYRTRGTTSSTLLIEGVNSADVGLYDVVITNACCSTVSASAELSLCLNISSQPVGQFADLGQMIELSVEATGTSALAYQWYRDGVPLTDNARISGTATGHVTISPLMESDVGGYIVRVSNDCGSLASAYAGVVLWGTCGTADFNNDGDLGTDLDIEAFFACLGGNCCSTCGSADFNGDGDTGTDIDIEEFFSCLGGACCDRTPLPCGSADFDGDGDTGTDADIEAFFACMGGNCCGTCGSADFNGDGDTGTDVDIEAFFRVLGGGNC